MEISQDLQLALEVSGWTTQENSRHYTREHRFGTEVIYRNERGMLVYANHLGVDVVAISPIFSWIAEASILTTCGAIDMQKLREEAEK